MSFIRAIAKFNLIFIIASILTMCTSEVAFATLAPDPIGNKLCEIIKLLQGNTARAIAMVAIMMLAVGAFTGRLQWTTVMVTLIGIVIIFKSGDFVNMIASDKPGDNKECKTT